jgi:hypothetical protein
MELYNLLPNKNDTDLFFPHYILLGNKWEPLTTKFNWFNEPTINEMVESLTLISDNIAVALYKDGRRLIYKGEFRF